MKMLATVVVSLVVSALTFVAMHMWVAPRLPVSAVEVPSLGGMTIAQARGLAEPRGLLLVIDEEKTTDRGAPGTVCEQKPLPGSMLRRGDEVHAAIAKRGDTVRVPQTTGMTPAAARELIERAHLRVGGSSQVPDPQTPAGLVLTTVPPAGSDAPWQSNIELKVSAGAMTTPVPQLFGKRLSTAKDLLIKAGFVVGTVKQGSNEDRDPGEVIGQTPKAAEPAAVGSKVDLVVNGD